MAIVPEREAPWEPDEGQYVAGSAYGGYFPEAMPTGLVPPWERLDPELERLEKEGQQLRAENKARIEQLQSNDWLVPAEKAKLASGELTQEQAAEMGQYRKRMFTEAKAMREEAKRPKTGRERFIKTVLNNPIFGGIDPRFIDRQKAKKKLDAVKLAEYKKAHQESFNKEATGSTLFKMMVISTKEADQEIDNKTDKQITILGNLIKHYDGQQKAKAEAAQKEQTSELLFKRQLIRDVLKEELIKRRPDEAPKLKAMLNKEGKWTYHEVRAGQYIDTGMGAQAPPKPSVTEREMIREKGAVSKLQTMAEKDPNKVYEHGYKMNEDKTLYLDPVTNAPVKLPPFHKVMGKRGQIKAMKQLGENWDDAKQLMVLLQNPEVTKNLQLIQNEVGFWSRVGGKWNNKIKLWMQNRGIATNSATGTAIARMQRLASQERKRFLGTAVTATELKTTLGWMPNAGDSLSTMLNKTQLAVQEGEETFRRYLDIYKDVANMTPFYKAFGLQRFGETGDISTTTFPKTATEYLQKFGGQ